MNSGTFCVKWVDNALAVLQSWREIRGDAKQHKTEFWKVQREDASFGSAHL